METMEKRKCSKSAPVLLQSGDNLLKILSSKIVFLTFFKTCANFVHNVHQNEFGQYFIQARTLACQMDDRME